MTEKQNLGVMENCPRTSFCSVNKCPLDVDFNLRNELKCEQKCNLAKSIRLKIGQKFGLANMGLTKSEQAARIRFEKMSQSAREKFIRDGIERLKTIKTRSE